jgi:hypothetical protein
MGVVLVLAGRATRQASSPAPVVTEPEREPAAA